MADESDGKPDDGEEVLNIQQSKSEESLEAIAVRRRRGGVLDGIKLEDPDSYLKREDLVQKAINRARQAGILVVSSPPGSGKTSLIQLMIQSLHQNDRDNVHAEIVRPSRPSRPNFDLFDYVRDRIGVSYEEKTLSANLQSYSEVWLLFDDAQKLYGQKFHEFWQDVVKTRNSIGFGKKTTTTTSADSLRSFRRKRRNGSDWCANVIVVVSATYFLTNEDDSPIALRSQPRIEVEDLLLTKDEAKELFEIRFVYPSWRTYESDLFRLTNGNAAAFAIGMDIIGYKSFSVDNRSEEILSEEMAVKELHEGVAFLESLERCFPLKTVDTESHFQILDSIVDAYKVDVGEGFTSSRRDNDAVSKLKKAGILSKSNRFTCPAAASFYYSMVYPRASFSSEPPWSLAELVTKATARLSARLLRVARQVNKMGVLQTPKEAVFQQLFHESIASLLPPSYRIVPEYGTEALMQGKMKTGELDFYIRHGAKWGLELVRDGDGIGEHLRRIIGKYQNVEADEWLVVDCRVNGGRPNLAADRCSLVFADDCRSCQCYMRLSPQPTTIQLME